MVDQLPDFARFPVKIMRSTEGRNHDFWLIGIGGYLLAYALSLSYIQDMTLWVSVAISGLLFIFIITVFIVPHFNKEVIIVQRDRIEVKSNGEFGVRDESIPISSTIIIDFFIVPDGDSRTIYLLILRNTPGKRIVVLYFDTNLWAAKKTWLEFCETMDVTKGSETIRKGSSDFEVYVRLARGSELDEDWDAG